MAQTPTPKTIRFKVNGEAQRWQGDGEQPLLWVLRESLGLTGSKYGCGVGQCGACTVHVDGRAVRSCLRPMATLQGAAVTTIEGLGSGEQLHPVQQAWIDEDVAQCGYCQAGQIMAAVDLLRRKPRPSQADIHSIGNLCRCGTQVRIRKAIVLAASRIAGAAK